MYLVKYIKYYFEVLLPEKSQMWSYLALNKGGETTLHKTNTDRSKQFSVNLSVSFQTDNRRIHLNSLNEVVDLFKIYMYIN